MSDFLVGLAVGVGVLATLALVAFFLLRRTFERAANRVADDIGRVLADLSGQAAATPLGRRTATGAKAASGRFTRMEAYAAAQGLSEDAARREFADSIERVARLMDSAVKLPILGRIGLDPVLGLFPVAGDAISAGISIMLIVRSIRYGVPREIIARMLANVLLDLVIGAVPIVGDLGDIWFRANLRNVALLREYLGDEARDIIDVAPERVS